MFVIRIDTEIGKSGIIVIGGERKQVITELVFMLEELEEHLGDIWLDAFNEFVRRKGL